MAGDFYDVFRVGAHPHRRGDRRRHRPRHRAVDHRLPGQVPAAGVPPPVPRPGPGARGAQPPDVGPRARRGVHLDCVVVFDTEAGTLRYASAGHPAAWLWHDREVRPLRATGPLLMLDPDGDVHQPGDPARRRRPAPALHRRAGRGPRRRAALRRGAHRQHAAPRPRRGARRAVQVPARGGRATSPPSPIDRRRRHPRHPPRRSRDRPTMDDELAGRTERALAGNLAQGRRRSSPRQGKLFVRDRLALLLDDGLVRRGRPARQRRGRRPARRRRGHRRRARSTAGRCA